MKKTTFNQNGVTLVEVMVSLVLFGISFGGLMLLLTYNISNAEDLRNATVASGLAQEGLEIVRSIRDQDWISERAWNSGFPGTLPATYEVQWNTVAPQDVTTGFSAITSVNPGNTRFLRKNPTSGLFSYTPTDTETGFKRTITITSLNAYEIRVVASISWKQRGATKNLNAESHLYNWY